MEAANKIQEKSMEAMKKENGEMEDKTMSIESQNMSGDKNYKRVETSRNRIDPDESIIYLS